jgi:hypothetical protein
MEHILLLLMNFLAHVQHFYGGLLHVLHEFIRCFMSITCALIILLGFTLLFELLTNQLLVRFSLCQSQLLQHFIKATHCFFYRFIFSSNQQHYPCSLTHINLIRLVYIILSVIITKLF